MKSKTLLAFLFLATSCFATTTVTGSLKNLGTGSVTSSSDAFVRFWLRGCRGNQPRITGTGAIAPQQSPSGVFYFDLAADASGNVSGTIYSTRDSSGTGNGEIECGLSYTAVWYGMQIYNGGAWGPEVPITAKSGSTVDVSSVTPNTTQPVSTAPTGDSTYLRLDGGNSPITGPISVKQLNGQPFADQYASISSALSALGSSPGTVFLKPGSYSTSATLTLAAGQHLRALGGCLPGEGSSALCGAVITWTGANNTAVINVHNASGAGVDGVSVDCANTTGCIGILYDSNNTPASSQNTFTNVTLKGCHFCFVNGLASTTADTNGYQADTFRLENFQIYCNSSDLTAVGILINSSNAAQNSVIHRGNVQSCNKAFEGVKSNGLLTLAQWNAGSPTGSSPVMLQFDANFGPYKLDGMESEGAWTYAIHDSSSLGTANNSTWLSSQFNTTPAGQVLVDGNSMITSVGNGGTNTTWAVGGTAKVISIDEAIWTPSAAVTTISTAGSTVGNTLRGLNYIAATATGSVPGGLSAGDLAAVRGTTSGVVFIGSDGLAYISRDSSGNLQPAKGIETGGTNGGMGASDISSARTSTTGAYFLGTDGNCYLLRSATLQIPSGCGALALGGGASINKFLTNSPTVTWTAIAANTCQEQTATVTGATSGAVALASPQTNLGLTNFTWSAYTSASNTVTIRGCNPTTGSITPNSASWTVWVLQ